MDRWELWVAVLAVAAVYLLVRRFRRRDAADESGLRIEPAAGEAPPRVECAASVSGTAAPFEVPLWLYGTGDAERWLLPPRSPQATAVTVVDFTDRYADRGDQERDWVVDMAAFHVAEHLWLHTDAPASAAVLIETSRRKLIQPVGAAWGYDDLLPFLGKLDPRPAALWGDALPDPRNEGFRVWLRLPDEDSDRSLDGPLERVPESAARILAQRGRCRELQPPAWYRLPAPARLWAYTVLLHNLQLQVLADRRNGILPPIDADLHHRFVELALDARAELPDAGRQLDLIAATTAVYAARAGELTEADRRRTLEALRGVADPDDPLFRLSPHWLRVLGEPAEADARRRQLRAGAPEPYREWLEKLPLPD
jgi:hypothetical protein